MMPTPLSDQQVTLLTFLALPVEGKGTVWIDPVRIQKGLFVFAQECPSSDWPKSGQYDFQPYHYGPYAFDINRDIDLLASCNLCEIETQPMRSWLRYRASDAGKDAVRELLPQMNSNGVTYLREIKKFVYESPFEALLKAIYKNYPTFAVRSVFKH